MTDGIDPLNDTIGTIKDVVHQLETLSKLVQFVLEHAHVADQIGQVELAAAEGALSDMALSNDWRSQTWNAIGHLESALHATIKATEDAARNNGRIVVFGEAYGAYVLAILSRVQYILCLMIGSYSILEETALCKKYIGMLKEAEKYGNTSGWARGASRVIKWAGVIPYYGWLAKTPRYAYKTINQKCMKALITPYQVRGFVQGMEERLETRQPGRGAFAGQWLSQLLPAAQYTH